MRGSYAGYISHLNVYLTQGHTLTNKFGADRLQYLFWYHRQRILGWWNPSMRARRQQGRIWTGFWIHVFRPVLRFFVNRTLRKHGWEGRHQRVLARLVRVNEFKDLEAI